jgi:arylsulfatase A-like enzyme
MKSSSRRDFLAGAGIAPAAWNARGQSAPPATKLPNILYIHSHDSGRYLEPYGQPIATPNLRRLASEGMLFRQAFSAAPTCSPSRAALLTGQYAHQSGMLGLAHRGFSLNDYRQHVIHTLRAVGYRSVLAGLQHVAAKPETIGYDEILHPQTTHAMHVAPGAAAFLDKRPPGPFFLDVGFFETHREYPQASFEDNPRATQPPRPMPDTPETREDMARYHASARLLDEGVGIVLAALERNGYLENTLVISTTDHGISFPRMKCNLTDDGFGVSLIMRGPGGFTGGKVSDAMVTHLDIFPTLCELTGAAKPAWLEGKSLLPLVRGEVREIHEEVFAEVNYHASYEPKRAARTRRWKYIRHFGGRKTPVLPNCDDSPSKSVWLEHGWKDLPVPEESLYDLVFDPCEEHNLAADSRHEEALKEMRSRMDRWMKATNDPLLNGPVKAPAGARVNDPDGISPTEPTIPA